MARALAACIVMAAASCAAVPEIASGAASAVSAYWSYRSATAKRVQVVARECLFMTTPVYMSRESTLVREDKLKLAELNASWNAICAKEDRP